MLLLLNWLLNVTLNDDLVYIIMWHRKLCRRLTRRDTGIVNKIWRGNRHWGAFAEKMHEQSHDTKGAEPIVYCFIISYSDFF